jgi:predicted lipoprotein
MNQAASILIAIVVLSVGIWLVPLVHLVPLKSTREVSTDSAFNPSVFVEKFWSERLLNSVDKAVDSAALLAEIKQNSKEARDKHGRTLGLSSTYYYFVSGTGHIVAVDKDSVSLTLGAKDSTVDIILETGNIFGNAVRDGTGLIDVNDYPNSRDFNDISSEINRRIEERVLPPLRAKATVGATVHFAGCAEISSETTDLHPLVLVPIVAEVQ